jgi:hypothetical protein
MAPKFSDSVTRLSTWPNLLGTTSYIPQISFPPPFGSSAFDGAMTQ